MLLLGMELQPLKSCPEVHHFRYWKIETTALNHKSASKHDSKSNLNVLKKSHRDKCYIRPPPSLSISVANINNSSMAYCKTAISPFLTHWRFCSLALSHPVDFFIPCYSLFYRFISNTHTTHAIQPVRIRHCLNGNCYECLLTINKSQSAFWFLCLPPKHHKNFTVFQQLFFK